MHDTGQALNNQSLSIISFLQPSLPRVSLLSPEPTQTCSLNGYKYLRLTLPLGGTLWVSAFSRGAFPRSFSPMRTEDRRRVLKRNLALIGIWPLLAMRGGHMGRFVKEKESSEEVIAHLLLCLFEQDVWRSNP